MADPDLTDFRQMVAAIAVAINADERTMQCLIQAAKIGWEWLANLKDGPGDIAEAVYSEARQAAAAKGQLPRYLRPPWQGLCAGHREIYIEIASRALKQKGTPP